MYRKFYFFFWKVYFTIRRFLCVFGWHDPCPYGAEDCCTLCILCDKETKKGGE